MRKKILILGGTGFIGRNLKEKLKSNYNLYTPSHKELDLLNELEVNKYFKKNKFDIVINAVVIGGSRKEESEENELYKNLLIFFNIINNKKYFKKYIHFGSGAEYDKSSSIINIKESDFGKRIPKDYYGFFKYVCSQYIQQMNNAVCLRIFGLFGKYEDYRYRFISNAILASLIKKQITINRNVFFDYVFINDFIKIVDYFINHKPKHKFYNIGTGKKIDLFTIARKLNVLVDKKTKIIIKNKGLSNEYSCNNTRLIKELKKFKFTPFDQALKELYFWYKTEWKKN